MKLAVFRWFSFLCYCVSRYYFWMGLSLFWHYKGIKYFSITLKIPCESHDTMFCLFFSQEALAQICEYSEAGITVRGTFVPPNKEPKDGERRLYLAIEATSEMSIQKAKKEITRLIKEELCRLVCRLSHCFTVSLLFIFFLQQNSYQPINKGRYKVVWWCSWIFCLSIIPNVQ